MISVFTDCVLYTYFVIIFPKNVADLERITEEINKLNLVNEKLKEADLFVKEMMDRCKSKIPTIHDTD